MTTKEKSKSKWNNRTQCSAIYCKNYQCNTTNVAFHRFPKDPDRCARWVLHLRNASLLGISAQQLNHSYRVCSAHFHSSQFKRPSDVHAGLKWNAVPTMIDACDPPSPPSLKLKRKPPKTRQELPPKKPKGARLTAMTQTGSARTIINNSECVRLKEECLIRRGGPEGSSSADGVQHPSGSETRIPSPDPPAERPSSPTCLDAAAKERTLKMKIRSLQVQVCKLKAKMREASRLKKAGEACVDKKSVMEELKKLLPAKTYAFVHTQIQMSQRKPHGFRWSALDKAFFSSLLRASPKCYRLLFEVFSMPSVRTLQKLEDGCIAQGRPMNAIDPENVIDEYRDARVTTDGTVDETGTVNPDPQLTAIAGAHQTSSFSSGNQGEPMDCCAVFHSRQGSESSGTGSSDPQVIHCL